MANRSELRAPFDSIVRYLDRLKLAHERRGRVE